MSPGGSEAAAGGGGSGESGDGGGAANRGGSSGGGTTGGGGTVSISSGGDDGNEGAAGDVGLGECGGSLLGAAFTPANFLLVLDKSGSMDAEFAGSTRWAVLEQAVNELVFGDGAPASYGLLLFPSTGTCGVGGSPDVAVQPLVDGADLIEEALGTAIPDGGSPTAAALSTALTYFSAGGGAALEGDKFVVLVTDGGPNCNQDLLCDFDACTPNIEEAASPGTYPACDEDTNCCTGAPELCLDDQASVDAVEALADADVKTVIVSLPQTAVYGQLFTQLALAGEAPDTGGTGVYASVNGAGIDLAELLAMITRELASPCKVRLDAAPPNPELVNVVIDGQVIPQSSEQGWIWDLTTSPPSIELLGDTCDYLEVDGNTSLQVVVGCPTLVD